MASIMTSTALKPTTSVCRFYVLLAILPSLVLANPTNADYLDARSPLLAGVTNVTANAEVNSLLQLIYNSDERRAVIDEAELNRCLLQRNASILFEVMDLLSLNSVVELSEKIVSSFLQKKLFPVYTALKSSGRLPASHDLVNTKNVDQYSALHLAARLDYAVLFQTLIVNGADMFLEGRKRRTPIDVAVNYCSPNVAKVLVEMQVSSTFTDHRKSLFYGKPQNVSGTLLHYAAKTNKKRLAKYLLLAIGNRPQYLTIQERYSNNTPLHYAIMNKHPQVSAMLLQSWNNMFQNRFDTDASVQIWKLENLEGERPIRLKPATKSASMKSTLEQFRPRMTRRSGFIIKTKPGYLADLRCLPKPHAKGKLSGDWGDGEVSSIFKKRTKTVLKYTGYVCLGLLAAVAVAGACLCVICGSAGGGDCRCSSGVGSISTCFGSCRSNGDPEEIPPF